MQGQVRHKPRLQALKLCTSLFRNLKINSPGRIQFRCGTNECVGMKRAHVTSSPKWRICGPSLLERTPRTSMKITQVYTAQKPKRQKLHPYRCENLVSRNTNPVPHCFTNCPKRPRHWLSQFPLLLLCYGGRVFKHYVKQKRQNLSLP